MTTSSSRTFLKLKSLVSMYLHDVLLVVWVDQVWCPTYILLLYIWRQQTLGGNGGNSIVASQYAISIYVSMMRRTTYVHTKIPRERQSVSTGLDNAYSSGVLRYILAPLPRSLVGRQHHAGDLRSRQLCVTNVRKTFNNNKRFDARRSVHQVLVEK